MRRAVTEVAKEVNALEMQGIPLTFRKKQELLYNQDVLNGKISVEEAYKKMLSTKTVTSFLTEKPSASLPELQTSTEPEQTFTQDTTILESPEPVKENADLNESVQMKYGGSLPDLPKYQNGQRVLQPWEYIDKQGKLNTDVSKLPVDPEADKKYKEQLDFMRNWIPKRGTQMQNALQSYIKREDEQHPVDAFLHKYINIPLFGAPYSYGLSKEWGTTNKELGENILETAVNNVNTVKFTDSSKINPKSYVPSAYGTYSPNSHSINFSSYPTDATKIHEIGHGTRLGSYRVFKDLIRDTIKEDKLYKDKRDSYYHSPEEIYSRIWEIRKGLNLNPTETITKELLKRKLEEKKSDYRINDYLDLFKYLEPETIIELLNGLVYEDTALDMYKAQNGGYLPKYQDGTPASTTAVSLPPLFKTEDLIAQAEYIKKISANQAAAKQFAKENPSLVYKGKVETPGKIDYPSTDSRSTSYVGNPNLAFAAGNTTGSSRKYMEDAFNTEVVGALLFEGIPMAYRTAAPIVKTGTKEIGKTIKDVDSALGESLVKLHTGQKPIDPVKFTEKVNDALEKGYGINKTGKALRVEYDENSLYPAMNIFIDGESTGFMDFAFPGYTPRPLTKSFSSEYIKNIHKTKELMKESPRYKTIVRLSDFPFTRLYKNKGKDAVEELMGKGISGELSKAVSETAKSYGTVLESSESHLTKGMFRYLNNLEKGHVQLPISNKPGYEVNKRLAQELSKIRNSPEKYAEYIKALESESTELLPTRVFSNASNAVYRYKRFGGYLSKYQK